MEKNSLDYWQYKKVCSVESGLRQKGHLSSEANLYFSSSFFVVIILCTTLKVNCLSLLSFEDLYIFTKQSLQFGSSEKLFFQALTAEGSETSFSMSKTIVLSSIWKYSEVAPSRSEPNAFRFKSGGMAAINWKQWNS